MSSLKRSNYLRCPERCYNTYFTAARLRKHLYRNHRRPLGNNQYKDHSANQLDTDTLNTLYGPTDDEWKEINEKNKRKKDEFDVTMANIGRTVDAGELNWVGTGPLNNHANRVKKHTKRGRTTTRPATNSRIPPMPAGESVKGGAMPDLIPEGAEAIDLTFSPEDKQSSGEMPAAPSGIQVNYLPSPPVSNKSSGAMPAVPVDAEAAGLIPSTQSSRIALEEDEDFLLKEWLRDVPLAADTVVLTASDVEAVRHALRSSICRRQAASRAMLAGAA